MAVSLIDCNCAEKPSPASGRNRDEPVSIPVDVDRPMLLHLFHPPAPRPGAPIVSRPANRRLNLILLPLFLAALTASFFVVRSIVQHSRANWGVVVPGKLFRSAKLPRPLLHDKLVENKIGMIVLLTHDTKDENSREERDEAKALGVEIRDFYLNGVGLGKPSEYTGALVAIWEANQQGRPVLIHCASGAHRTGGVVAVYRVLVERASPLDARRELEKYGWKSSQNSKLIPFLNQNMRQWAQALVDRGIIPEVPEPLPQFAP
jgi:protein-tyrosine phosphatase